MTEMEISELFKQEAFEHIEGIESALLHFEKATDKQELLNTIFRHLHTLKGSGNMAGFIEVAEYIHDLETKFEDYRNGKNKLDNQGISTFLDACDGIRSLIHVKPLGHVSKEIPKNVASNTNSKTWHISFTPGRDFFSEGQSAVAIFSNLQQLGSLELTLNTDSLPTFKKLNPEFCYLSWNASLVTNVDKNTIEDVFSFVEASSIITISEQPIENPRKPALPSTDTMLKDPFDHEGPMRGLLCHVGETAFLIPAQGIRACKPEEGTVRRPIGLSMIDGHQETIFDVAEIFKLQASNRRIHVLIQHRSQSFGLAVETFDDFIEGNLQVGKYKPVLNQGIRGFLVCDEGSIYQVLNLDWFLDLNRRVMETKNQSKLRVK